MSVSTAHFHDFDSSYLFFGEWNTVDEEWLILIVWFDHIIYEPTERKIEYHHRLGSTCHFGNYGECVWFQCGFGRLNFRFGHGRTPWSYLTNKANRPRLHRDDE